MTQAALPDAPTTMSRLKAETAQLHRDAETSRFQRALVQGKVGREGYRAWLGQMLLIHEALDVALRAVAAAPAVAAVNRPDYERAADLRADLAELGEDTAQAPLPATAALVSRIGAADALALLGMRYVLEGSNNGNSFIAEAIRRELPGAPTRYLDPYGELQRERWAGFKRDMEAAAFGPAEQDRLVAAARQMFESIRDLSGQLAAAALPASGA